MLVTRAPTCWQLLRQLVLAASAPTCFGSLLVETMAYLAELFFTMTIAMRTAMALNAGITTLNAGINNSCIVVYVVIGDVVVSMVLCNNACTAEIMCIYSWSIFLTMLFLFAASKQNCSTRHIQHLDIKVIP